MAQIDRLFAEMKKQDCSDLHMIVGLPPMVRKKGELVPIGKLPALSPEKNRQFLYEIMSPHQQQIFEDESDLDFAYEVKGLARFRANILAQHRGIGGIFRIIPTEILRAEQLGLPEAVLKITEERQGLILVTGPTGSGKSTTLAAMINHINETRSAHIITLEDPLEFVHDNIKCLITQREVGDHTLSFNNALRATSRQDADIILVGEMRDVETISMAISCAERGQLVFGTLHTNSAAKTIDRIIDVFPPDEQGQVRSMMSESLKGVIAQQLLKTADGKGRCAAIEILIGSSALANVIREGKTTQIPSIIQGGKGVGMQSMDQSLLDFIQEGKVLAEDAVLKANDKSLFQRFLKGESGGVDS
ncbi:MAG: type IV pilus twitching motility protein PilT [Proteobacteria bacterium]|nr:type IV pilus twitching motility protein PilT [Pseudomonadota bacterium]